MPRQQHWSQSISFAHSQGYGTHGRHLRRSRPPVWTETPDETLDDGPGLMTSRAFWLGGALSLGFWTLLALVVRGVF